MGEARGGVHLFTCFEGSYASGGQRGERIESSVRERARLIGTGLGRFTDVSLRGRGGAKARKHSKCNHGF
jgi:hypothetical protein